MNPEINTGIMPQTERDLGFTLPHVRGDLLRSVMPLEPQNPASGKEFITGMILTDVGIILTLYGLTKVMTAKSLSEAAFGLGLTIFGIWCIKKGYQKMTKKFLHELPASTN